MSNINISGNLYTKAAGTGTVADPFVQEVIAKPFGTAVAMGEVDNVAAVHVFGHSRNGIQTTATDIWERADATPTQQVWLAPTAARVHAIVSSSASDDGAPAGVGANTVQIIGLKDWNTPEIGEVVILNGTTPVDTVNTYVCINHMEVVAYGASGPNVGTITATAAVDGTISAAILATEGLTEMAIYAIPTGQTFYMTRLGASMYKNSETPVDGVFVIRQNKTPTVQTTLFFEVNELSLQSTGTSGQQKTYEIPLRFNGPTIIKIMALASAADTEAVVSFDGYLVTN